MPSFNSLVWGSSTLSPILSQKVSAGDRRETNNKTWLCCFIAPVVYFYFISEGCIIIWCTSSRRYIMHIILFVAFKLVNYHVSNMSGSLLRYNIYKITQEAYQSKIAFVTFETLKHKTQYTSLILTFMLVCHVIRSISRTQTTKMCRNYSTPV